jgi:SH3-like domain-containing protein
MGQKAPAAPATAPEAKQGSTPTEARGPAAPTATGLGTGAMESGLKLPRFVSLNSAKVNVRAGPGVRYPITLQFVRRGLPVEVVAEFEYWRKIRDQDGAEGWVHKSLLSGRRTVVVSGNTVRQLLRKPEFNAEVVARMESGVQARLLACKGEWCQLEVGSWRGFLPRDQIWGVYPDETFE